MSGVGSQMRAVPEVLRTSTRVVTSKVRQWSTVVSVAKTRPAFANARPAETIPVDRKKSRRFIPQLLELEILFLISYERIAYTRLARSCKTRRLRLEIGTLDTMRFEDADKYAAYLKTPGGRLRSELAWENVRRFLPGNASECRALDVGGGTGFVSAQLARLGFEVVLLDGSGDMLRIARQEKEARGVTARISFCHADVGQLPRIFEAESFDVVVCHNLLEYTEDPSATIRDIAHVLRKDGVFSILVRNRAGEVLKEAVKSRDWKLAAANLTAEMVRG